MFGGVERSGVSHFLPVYLLRLKADPTGAYGMGLDGSVDIRRTEGRLFRVKHAVHVIGSLRAIRSQDRFGSETRLFVCQRVNDQAL